MALRCHLEETKIATLAWTLELFTLFGQRKIAGWFRDEWNCSREGIATPFAKSRIVHTVCEEYELVTSFTRGKIAHSVCDEMIAYCVRRSQDCSLRSRRNECSLRSRKKSSLTGAWSSLREERRNEFSLRPRRNARYARCSLPSMLAMLAATLAATLTETHLGPKRLSTQHPPLHLHLPSLRRHQLVTNIPSLYGMLKFTQPLVCSFFRCWIWV
jgi:hypothetical protein